MFNSENLAQVAATTRIPATLIIGSDPSRRFSSHKLRGTLSITDPHRADFVTTAAVKIDGREVHNLVIVAKYTKWLTNIGGEQQVSVFQANHNAEKLEDSISINAVIRFDIVTASQRMELNSIYAIAGTILFWCIIWFITIYGGLRYHFAYGTATINFPISTRVLSFALAMSFWLSVGSWGWPGGIRRALQFYAGNLKLISIFVGLSALSSIFLSIIFLPAYALMATANAWLDFSPPIHILGYIDHVSSQLEQVEWRTKFSHLDEEYYVVTVVNGVDGKRYLIDIPKEKFERERLGKYSPWNDTLFPGAFGVPYRIGEIPNGP